MCAIVVFQYRCRCTERVVFECPFSSATNSILGEDLQMQPQQNCSRRYRRHQERLLTPENTTETAVTTPSHRPSLSRPLQMMIPILLPPTLPYPEKERTNGQKTIETKTTEIDELCHDCWRHSLWLAKQKDDDKSASSSTIRDNIDEADDVANRGILRERSANEFILPQPNTDSEAVSSGGSFSVD
ncbi:hypothetical protein F5Y10DRAFT_181828 [Nemania abortiva]|nr:hypothetical protein F5Y10DRAFT_181828 [Nemania abortiva]